ncbi:hypothetical protein [Mesobacillus harenae]|uniref:hypothetical protein n=1 Tax=Mesobacillus harenae TaxID=2213203 RepID=UPI0015809852|nr:hypothetical protein [Mesobacillus harenae]
MIRMSVAGIGGFILVFIETFIVMKLKNYHSIEFGGVAPFVNVWAMNFFMLFAMFTQYKNWHEEKEAAKEETQYER